MSELTLLERDQGCLDEDARLVLTAQQNPTEFKLLYQKWLKPIYRYFYFRLGNTADAEDLTSQVFLKAYQDLPRYQNRGNFSGWLFTIAHSRVVDFYRKSGREVSLDAGPLVSLDPDPLTQAVESTQMRQVMDIMRSLPENEQELLRLRFAAELNYREIGQVVHRSEGAVRKSIVRLIERLQAQLEVTK
jgi:RNA polymerase sigma-70 factor (ECF subfamily)